MSAKEISEDIRSNFHLFWDNFPAAVMLVYKDRTILAVNKVGEAAGISAAMRCVDMGEKKHHALCQANAALKEKTGKRYVGYIEHLGLVLDSYWIPLAGAEDIYVHFGTDITEYAAEYLKSDNASCSSGCDNCSC